jgi:methionine aminopeptidase
MSLRVIWQYMDRSVTKKILYGPQLRSISAALAKTNRENKNVKCNIVKYLPLFHHFKAIYQFPKHNILPYDPQCHELFAI